ncbi:MAG: hypothetical protein LBU24_02605 [Methanocalculaceae archaeon]|nr:hypothetical protein [Methanocalculaceae archaeon]
MSVLIVTVVASIFEGWTGIGIFLGGMLLPMMGPTTLVAARTADTTGKWDQYARIQPVRPAEIVGIGICWC